MTRKRSFVIIFIFLLIALVAFALNEYVQETLAPSILAWLWRVWILSGGFPQMMTWAFFVAVIPVVAIFSLIQGRPSYEEEIYPHEKQYPGQLHTLTRWLQQAPQGDYFRMRLMRHLSKLALETLEYRERMESKEIKEKLKSGEIVIEPEVYGYLKKGWRKRGYDTTVKKPSRGRRSALTHRGNGSEANRWRDPETELVVQFLENELEVKRES